MPKIGAPADGHPNGYRLHILQHINVEDHGKQVDQEQRRAGNRGRPKAEDEAGAQEQNAGHQHAKFHTKGYNSIMKVIYLDHNATTPIRSEAIEMVGRAQAENFANPASQHQPGQRARRVLEETREHIAALLGADLTCPQPDRVIFTSGGTESNNLALLGIAGAAAERAADSSNPPQLIISSVEHQSVIEPAEHLLERGFRLDTLPVDSNGVVRTGAVESLLTPKTSLVSVIFANHETGVLQPVAEIVELCSSAKVPVHTDAVQAVGKVPIQFRELGVAAMSVAAHKLGGPLGIGALILRPDVRLKPLLYGGHQQFGLRPGTESVPLALGMLTALEMAEKEREENNRRITRLRERFENGLRAGFPEIIVHGGGR